MLAESRALGFLGPGPIDTHLAQARAYLAALPDSPGALVVDLGTGGGIPGLPLAFWRSDLQFFLVDSMIRRTDFVSRAIAELGLSATVRCDRAETLGRDPAFRGGVDVVVARSLAAPAVTAEYAAPLLRAGGYALVAEPPEGDASRWPAAGLVELGMRLGPVIREPGGTLQRLDQAEPCPARFPRRVGQAAKRPLFGR